MRASVRTHTPMQIKHSEHTPTPTTFFAELRSRGQTVCVSGGQERRRTAGGKKRRRRTATEEGREGEEKQYEAKCLLSYLFILLHLLIMDMDGIQFPPFRGGRGGAKLDVKTGTRQVAPRRAMARAHNRGFVYRGHRRLICQPSEPMARSDYSDRMTSPLTSPRLV